MYIHNITLAGTTSDEGIYSGTYSVNFSLTNLISTKYTTIAAIAEAIGENFVDATGIFHTTTAGDLQIKKVLEWQDSSLNKVVAILDDTNQKVGMSKTTADTITDTIQGEDIMSTFEIKVTGRRPIDQVLAQSDAPFECDPDKTVTIDVENSVPERSVLAQKDDRPNPQTVVESNEETNDEEEDETEDDPEE